MWQRHRDDPGRHNAHVAAPFLAKTQHMVIADTDAEAEKLYWPHIENFLSKSLHVAPHFAAVPGYTTRRSVESMLKATGNATPFTEFWPGKHSWAEQVEKHAVVIAGSPETVVQRLTEAAKDLRFGHLIALMQIQSMPTELTKYSTQLYAEKVMPHLKGIWSDYEDRWWPSGATRGQETAASAEARS
ncbi:MAG TPA: hypothetical protein VEX61_03575 [Burkholderiales bacterium]|nr:hypothetical protein [Burkholderiales bacterium]